MRFDPRKCPTCSQPARGTLDVIPGLALLLFDEEGNAEYLGQTDVNWDGQETIRDEHGRVRLMCPGGHEWSAVTD